MSTTSNQMSETRKDDPVHKVRATPLNHKGFPVGGNIETDDDTAFNRQLPPGQFIENQLLADGVARIRGMKAHTASEVLKSGTGRLD